MMKCRQGRMSAMEAAKAALRTTPLTIEQFKRINRMSLIDKLMPSSIASGLELELRDVEAALWKPAQAKSAYMAFQAFKSSEVRPTAPPSKLKATVRTFECAQITFGVLIERDHAICIGLDAPSLHAHTVYQCSVQPSRFVVALMQAMLKTHESCVFFRTHVTNFRIHGGDLHWN